VEAFFAGPWGPLLIFALRLVDVSLGTIRVVLAVRGMKVVAPLIGFFEISIWVVAVGTAIRFLDSPLHVVGYAAGFAAGTMMGLWIEEKMAFGMAVIRVMSRTATDGIVDAVRGRGFGATVFGGKGREGEVQMVYAALKRRHLPVFMEEVRAVDPGAFVTIEEPRAIHRGWMYTARRK